MSQSTSHLMLLVGTVVSLLLLLVVVLQFAVLPSPITVPGAFAAVNSPIHQGADLQVMVIRCLDDSAFSTKQQRYQTSTTRLLTNVRTGALRRFPELTPLSDIAPGCTGPSLLTISYIPDDTPPGTYVLSGVVSLVGLPRIASASATWTTAPFDIIP